MLRVLHFALLILSSTLALAVEVPIDVGNQKQLFINQKFIASSDRVTLVTIPAQKLGQILDAEGKPRMGYVSRVIIDQLVHWKGGGEVGSLAGRPVRLHIEMKPAKLYAFQFTAE